MFLHRHTAHAQQEIALGFNSEDRPRNGPFNMLLRQKRFTAATARQAR